MRQQPALRGLQLQADGLVPEIEAARAEGGVLALIVQVLERAQQACCGIGWQVIAGGFQPIAQQAALEQEQQLFLGGLRRIVELRCPLRHGGAQLLEGHRAGPGLDQGFHHGMHGLDRRAHDASAVVAVGAARLLVTGEQGIGAGKTQILQTGHVRLRQHAIGALLVRQQALAEITADCEVQVLLAHDLGLSERREAEIELDILSIRGTQLALRLRIAQVGQALLRGHFGEFDEIAGGVDMLQILVKDVVVRLFLERLHHFPNGGGQEIVVRQAVAQQHQHGPGTGQALVVVLRAVAVHQHGVAHHVAGLPAGIGVVTDVGHAQRREVFAADAQDGLLDFGRHPAEDAVHDDVVELAEFGGDPRQVQRMQLQVGDAEIAQDLLALPDLYRRKIHADHLRLRIGQGERQQVAARSATQFQHACLRQWHGLHAIQVSRRAQVARRAVAEGFGSIGFVVVVGFDLTVVQIQRIGRVHRASQMVIRGSVTGRRRAQSAEQAGV